VKTLSTIGRFITDAACAVLYALSISIGCGIVAAASSHRLLPTVVAALAGLVVAGSGFAYVIKRTYWPRGKTRMFEPIVAS
jgi:high-affinity Fe2+/Pb2+ permease